MVEGTKGFDSDLQMFRDAPRNMDLAHLRFQRWLVEHGRSEHPPEGPPSGELATLTDVDRILAEASA
jgi:hypothetical protein